MFPAVLSNARDGSLPPVYPMVAADGITMPATGAWTWESLIKGLLAMQDGKAKKRLDAR